jgi:hypothetical protein
MNAPTILNDPTSRTAVDLNQVSAETRQLSHLHLQPPPTRKLSIQVHGDSETEYAVTHMNEMRFLTNDQWLIGQEIARVVFQEVFVNTACKPV